MNNLNKSLIIGISGGSGSGKTSILRAIRNATSIENVCILSLDDYYFPRETQKIDPNGVTNFDLPGAIDSKSFLSDLTQLINGEVVERKEYTFNNPNAAPKVLVFKPAPIIIVEGLFVFHFDEIRALMGLKVYIHTKENLKLIRRIERDKNERNYPIEDVLYRYENHVMPTFEKYIEPYKEEADIVLVNNNQYSTATNVLIGYINDYIRNVKIK